MLVRMITNVRFVVIRIETRLCHPKERFLGALILRCGTGAAGSG